MLSHLLRVLVAVAVSAQPFLSTPCLCGNARNVEGENFGVRTAGATCCCGKYCRGCCKTSAQSADARSGHSNSKASCCGGRPSAASSDVTFDLKPTPHSCGCDAFASPAIVVSSESSDSQVRASVQDDGFQAVLETRSPALVCMFVAERCPNVATSGRARIVMLRRLLI